MSVHHAISKHVESQNKVLNEFFTLDQQREAAIEEAVTLCEQDKPFSVDTINAITKEMNGLSMKGELPKRKLVTLEMIREYVSKMN
ncbi:MAG: YpbS family protein [Bacillota bacterium]|nr:YpbS family protein [Bacillota bacterium]